MRSSRFAIVTLVLATARVDGFCLSSMRRPREFGVPRHRAGAQGGHRSSRRGRIAAATATLGAPPDELQVRSLRGPPTLRRAHTVLSHHSLTISIVLYRTVLQISTGNDAVVQHRNARQRSVCAERRAARQLLLVRTHGTWGVGRVGARVRGCDESNCCGFVALRRHPTRTRAIERERSSVIDARRRDAWLACDGFLSRLASPHSHAARAPRRRRRERARHFDNHDQPPSPPQRRRLEVYDFAHVGNFRAFLTYDVLKRWLTYCGYDVDHVCNLTDVDDKIITRAQVEEFGRGRPTPPSNERTRVWPSDRRPRRRLSEKTPAPPATERRRPRRRLEDKIGALAIPRPRASLTARVSRRAQRDGRSIGDVSDEFAREFFVDLEVGVVRSACLWRAAGTASCHPPADASRAPHAPPSAPRTTTTTTHRRTTRLARVGHSSPSSQRTCARNSSIRFPRSS